MTSKICDCLNALTITRFQQSSEDKSETPGTCCRQISSASNNQHNIINANAVMSSGGEEVAINKRT